MNYRSIATLDRQIIDWLGKLPRDLDLIVGVPRSGMLAANILALHLNRPLTDVDGLLAGKVMGTGWTHHNPELPRLLAQRRKVLVLDDSVSSGGQITKVRQRITQAGLPHDVYYAAIYVVPGREHLLDFHYESIPHPRCFEWNVLHHSELMPQCCVDIDGVLCRDPSAAENDDGPLYERFLQTVEPKMLPTKTVGWLVTCRLEKYRALTEAWLTRHGVTYKELVMMQFSTKAERRAANCYAEFKARAYKAACAPLFIESSLEQATAIARLAGKDVLCTETRELAVAGASAKALGMLSEQPRQWRRKLPRQWRLAGKARWEKLRRLLGKHPA